MSIVKKKPQTTSANQDLLFKLAVASDPQEYNL